MKKLKQNQADRFLEPFVSLQQLPVPNNGWVKYIRNSLGMTTAQLAKRAGVSQRRIGKIEQAEIHGATTLKTLNHVAEAMNCKLVYAIVPKTTIRQMIEEQARKFVLKHLTSVAHHMALESQSVKDKDAIEAQIKDLVEQYLSKSLKIIWDE